MPSVAVLERVRVVEGLSVGKLSLTLSDGVVDRVLVVELVCPVTVSDNDREAVP